MKKVNRKSGRGRASVPRAPSRRRRKPTILFVDDDPVIRKVARRMLQCIGYNSLIADSGEGAMDAFVNGSEKVDLVVTDHNMPHMKGEELALAIRQLDQTTRVVVTTGDSAVLSEAEITERPNIYYLSKPYTMENLKKVIERAFEDS